jgi:hypothetical protein
MNQETIPNDGDMEVVSPSITIHSFEAEDDPAVLSQWFSTVQDLSSRFDNVYLHFGKYFTASPYPEYRARRAEVKEVALDDKIALDGEGIAPGFLPRLQQAAHVWTRGYLFPTLAIDTDFQYEVGSGDSDDESLVYDDAVEAEEIQDFADVISDRLSMMTKCLLRENGEGFPLSVSIFPWIRLC